MKVGTDDVDDAVMRWSDPVRPYGVISSSGSGAVGGAWRTVGVVAPSAATILLVEETPAVQELVEQALRELGHLVLVTGDPSEALELARRVQIDLLVSDAVLLDRTLLRRLRVIQPRLRIIQTAGADGPADGEPGDTVGLSAPFSLKQLQEAVTACLDRVGPPLT